MRSLYPEASGLESWLDGVAGAAYTRRMADLVSRLQDAVGTDHVFSGDAIPDDYTHDEALTTARSVRSRSSRPADASEVAAVLGIAAELGVPVTARGAGTGLSGACTPLADGMVCALDRMQRIVEIDTDNHVAVVEPGVTLDQLDEALAPLGLVYPVYPGENSASLGGNVATNAGGMRAIKYGVTRHQVLGLEAVLATGEIIRTGGKFVKATTGYDLTQLIIGSEGTLAIVTEATLRIYPRPEHTATLLVPFLSLEDVAAAVPVIVRSGVGPLILEYVDGGGLSLLAANVGLDLGIAADVQETAAAYLDRRARRPPRNSGRRRSRRARRPAARARGASTSTSSRRRRPRCSLEARREGVLGGQADGRERHHRRRRAACVGACRISGRCARSPTSTEPTSARPATRATATSTSRCSRPTTSVRATVMKAVLRAGHRAGRRDLGRARHRQGQARLLPRARRPGQDRADAAHQGGIRPRRGSSIPARCSTDLRGGIVNGAHALIRTLVGAGVDICFANPGTSEMQFVAALDDVPEMRAVLALVRGRRNRRGRRVRPHGRTPGRDAAAPRSRPRERARQPAQRASCPHADGQHRRRPRDVSPWVRRAVAVRHRHDRSQLLDRGSATRTRPSMSLATPRRQSPRRRRPRAGWPRSSCPADTTWLEAGEPAAPIAPVAARPVPGDTVDVVAKALRSGEPAALYIGGRALRARGLLAASRVAQASGAKLLSETFPARLERGAGLPGGRTVGLLLRVRGSAAARHPPLGDRRHEAAGVVLRVSRQAEQPRPGRLRSPRARGRR